MQQQVHMRETFPTKYQIVLAQEMEKYKIQTMLPMMCAYANWDDPIQDRTCVVWPSYYDVHPNKSVAQITLHLNAFDFCHYVKDVLYCKRNFDFSFSIYKYAFGNLLILLDIHW